MVKMAKEVKEDNVVAVVKVAKEVDKVESKVALKVANKKEDKEVNRVEDKALVVKWARKVESKEAFLWVN